MIALRKMLGCLWCCVLLASCYYQGTGTSDAWSLTEQQMDSISFYTSHHYTQNFNFIVKADSLQLISQHPTEVVNGLQVDTFAIGKGNRIVVADISTMPADTIDSIWVKVARDQQTIGWIHESQLLPGVTPDAPISRFIDFFSDAHLLLFLAIVALTLAVYVVRKLMRLGAKMVHFNDIDSFYPTLLCLLVASSAVFYSTIQLVAPDSWRHYYYHPTLNPFAVPLHLGLFLLSVWVMVIAALAAIDDIRRHLSAGEAFFYYLGLIAVCAICYVVFSVSTLYYVGYPLLVAYIAVSVWNYVCRTRTNFLCGQCGRELHQKGKCPYCGTVNV
ncbi:MAG: zinc ribbon domain-containing protein [Prevotella sp.]|nr:zinc ribbon domain-containing protein [Prevotella sp.]